MLEIDITVFSHRMVTRYVSNRQSSNCLTEHFRTRYISQIVGYRVRVSKDRYTGFVETPLTSGPIQVTKNPANRGKPTSKLALVGLSVKPVSDESARTTLRRSSPNLLIGIRIFQLPTFGTPGIDSSLSHTRARKLYFCDDDLCGRHTAPPRRESQRWKKKNRNIQKRTHQTTYCSQK